MIQLQQFFDLLSQKIPAEVLNVPLSNEEYQATTEIANKERMSLLGESRTKERTWKTNQRRTKMSRSSLLLDKAPDLTKPNTPINTVNVRGSLLGNTQRN